MQVDEIAVPVAPILSPAGRRPGVCNVRPRPSSATSRLSSPAEVRIVVADDNADITDSAADIFEISGFQVARAYDGEAAVRVAFEFCPHIAFLDIGMPGQSGYAVARQLRARFGADILLVAVSGWGRDEDKAAAYESGFDIHHTKPVEAFDLVRLAMAHCDFRAC